MNYTCNGKHSTWQQGGFKGKWRTGERWVGEGWGLMASCKVVFQKSSSLTVAVSCLFVRSHRTLPRVMMMMKMMCRRFAILALKIWVAHATILLEFVISFSLWQLKAHHAQQLSESCESIIFTAAPACNLQNLAALSMCVLLQLKWTCPFARDM